MPMKITGVTRVTDTQLERIRRIAVHHGWMVGNPYNMGSHNQVFRELADGRALFVPLNTGERADLRRFLDRQLQDGRDQLPASALQALLNALDQADELANEAAEEKTAEEQPANA